MDDTRKNIQPDDIGEEIKKLIAEYVKLGEEIMSTRRRIDSKDTIYTISLMAIIEKMTNVIAKQMLIIKMIYNKMETNENVNITITESLKNHMKNLNELMSIQESMSKSTKLDNTTIDINGLNTINIRTLMKEEVKKKVKAMECMKCKSNNHSTMECFNIRTKIPKYIIIEPENTSKESIKAWLSVNKVRHTEVFEGVMDYMIVRKELKVENRYTMITESLGSMSR